MPKWARVHIRKVGWNDIIIEYFESMGGVQFLLRCNYDTANLKWIPQFYKELLDYFKTIKYAYNGECIIWNNKHIIIEGKSIFWKDWYENGVKYMQDLTNRNGTWMSFSQFSNKYNIRTNFLTYLGLLSAVKCAAKVIDVDLSIKPLINFQNREFKLSSGRLIDINKAKSRYFYTEFLEDILEAPTAISKWRIDYNLLEDKFYRSLTLVRICTKEPKLLAVQFKIIHNIVNCKSNLHKWNISEGDICEFCKTSEKDEIIHALCKCEHTKQFLKEIFRKIDPFNTCLGIMQMESFLFGVEDPAQNVIILLIKKYILNVRTFKLKFSINNIMNQIFTRIVLESKTMIWESFFNKWQGFQNLIEQAQKYWDSQNDMI